MPGRRYERDEIIACAYVAMYGAADLGGIEAVAAAVHRDIGSLKLKIRNVAAMLDAHGLPRDPSIRPLTGRTSGGEPRETDWPIVQPFTRLTLQEHLAICRVYIGTHTSPSGQRPSMANPYAPSSGYHRIFQRLASAPPVTEAELVEFAVTQMGKSRTAAESSVWVVISPREGSRNPRGNRSSKGHLYYVTQGADGKLYVHPRIPPLEPFRRQHRQCDEGREAST